MISIFSIILLPSLHVHVLHPHGDFLLFLPGHDLCLLPLLGSQGLCSGHVSSPYSSRVIPWHSCCVRHRRCRPGLVHRSWRGTPTWSYKGWWGTARIVRVWSSKALARSVTARAGRPVRAWSRLDMRAGGESSLRTKLVRIVEPRMATRMMILWRSTSVALIDMWRAPMISLMILWRYSRMTLRSHWRILMILRMTRW